MDLGLFADAVTQTRSRRADAPRPPNDGLGQVAARLPMLDVSCNHGVSMQQSRRGGSRTGACEVAALAWALAGMPTQASALCRWARRTSISGMAGIGRLEHHYAARRRNGEPISTAFLESAVNEIIAKRMNKKQQMRWNRATVQPFLDVRTAVLNDTLEDAFRRRYPGFRPANGNEVVALTA
jgi:hypothetical protein